MAHEDVKRGHVAATVFLTWLALFGEKSFFAEKKNSNNMSFEMQLIWIRASWSRDKMATVVNVASFVLLMHTVPTHEGACPPSRPRDMFSSVCRPLHSWLAESNHELDRQLHYVQRHYSTALVPTAVYSLGKHSRKSFTSVVANTRCVATFIVNRLQQVH